METTYRALAKFEAHHVDEELPRCARSHGHLFRVEVEATKVEWLEEDLHGLLLEWADKSLNEQLHRLRVGLGDLPPIIFERLAMRHNIIEITVSDGRLKVALRP